MVAFKIVFTVLGFCIVCSIAAPKNPSLISKLLAQSEGKDVIIPVRINGERVSAQNYHQKPHRETIYRILKGLLQRKQLSTKNVNNDNRSYQIASEENSEDLPGAQVSPNVNRDYLHIENYVPTFITLPCDSQPCDPRSNSNLDCQILSDVIHSKYPSSSSVLCPQNTPSHDVAGDDSYIINEAPKEIPLNSPSTEMFLSNTHKENLSLHASDNNLSDAEFAEFLQSEKQNIAWKESEHLITPELLPLPTLHEQSDFHDTHYNIFNIMNTDLQDSDYHKVSAFTPQPHHSLNENNNKITPEIATIQPLNPPSLFEPIFYIPQPPSYSPLSFANNPVIVIPEAPVLIPINKTADKIIQSIHSDYSGIFNSESALQDESILEITNTSDSQTNQGVNSENESTILIPEPPIYFPLNPPNTSVDLQSERGDIVSLSDNSDNNTIIIPENTPLSVNCQPIVVIPEAPELIPLNSSNLMFSSSKETTHELTKSEHADYSDFYPPEIITKPKEIVEGTYVSIISPTENLNSVSYNEHSVDHAHTITLEDAPYLLISHYINTHKDTSLDTSELTFSDIETSPIQKKPDESPAVHEINNLNSSEYLNISLDSSFANKHNNDEDSYYGNDEGSLFIDAIKIPDAPSFMPLNPPSTGSTYNYISTANPSSGNGFIIGVETSELASPIQNEPVEIPETPVINSLNSSESSYISLGSLLGIQNNSEEVIYNGNNNNWSTDFIEIPEAPSFMLLNPPYPSTPTTNNSFENNVIVGVNSINDNEVQTSLNNPLSPSASELTKDKLCLEYITNLKETEAESENTPLNILLTLNQQITLPHILQNSNVLVGSKNQNEICGQEDKLISSSPDHSSLVHDDAEPLSIVQNSNIVVLSSPINVEKTNEIVSQLDSSIHDLEFHNEKKQTQINFQNLPPCETEEPVDGVVINIFEPKKCKQEVKELGENSSSKQRTSKNSRRRIFVVRNRGNKIANTTHN